MDTHNDPQGTLGEPTGADVAPAATEAQEQAAPLEKRAKPAKSESLVQFKPVRDAMTAGDLAEITAALPPEMRPRAADYVRLVLVDIPRQPALAKAAQANPRSVISCLLDAARLGLRIGINGEAYLVSYGDTVSMIAGYRGLLALARRSGQIASLDAQCVYEGDTIEVQLGDSPGVVHRPALTGVRSEATCIGAYMVCRLTSGESVVEWMSRADIEAVRNRSRSAHSKPDKPKVPWESDWTEMARKTVLRRGLKRCPVVDEYAEAIRREDEAAPIDVTPVAEAPASPAARALTYEAQP
jgi:recombination protein RecT